MKAKNLFPARVGKYVGDSFVEGGSTTRHAVEVFLMLSIEIILAPGFCSESKSEAPSVLLIADASIKP